MLQSQRHRDASTMMTYDPFRLYTKHVHDEIRCGLGAVDRAMRPSFRQIGIMIRVGVPAMSFTIIGRCCRTHVRRYAVTLGTAPYLKASTATGIPVMTCSSAVISDIDSSLSDFVEWCWPTPVISLSIPPEIILGSFPLLLLLVSAHQDRERVRTFHGCLWLGRRS